MGKSRDDYKHKKRTSPSSPRDEDEGRSKRHRSKDEGDKKTGKDKSHRRHSRNDKKSDKKHRDKDRKRDSHSKLKIQELSNDDYFSKNNEFAKWLKEERNTFFSDLSSETARKLFSDFVEVWNKKELESEYYEGVSTGPRSSHKWNIKK